MIAVGGEGTTSVSDAVQAYDVAKRAWSQLPALPTARHGIAVTASTTPLYAIGGAATRRARRSTKERYVSTSTEPQVGTWVATRDGSAARATSHSAARAAKPSRPSPSSVKVSPISGVPASTATLATLLTRPTPRPERPAGSLPRP